MEGQLGRSLLRLYRHLDIGDRVATGEVIGTVGKTGNAATTPPHLHLQVKEDGDWKVSIASVTLGGGAPLLPRAITTPPLRLVAVQTFGEWIQEAFLALDAVGKAGQHGTTLDAEAMPIVIDPRDRPIEDMLRIKVAKRPEFTLEIEGRGAYHHIPG